MGKLYHCDKKTITTYAKKIGYDFSKHKERKITSIPLNEIITAYEELHSAAKVGEYYKCSGTAVLNHAKKIGYDINSAKVHKLTLQDKETIIATYDILSSTQLAE